MAKKEEIKVNVVIGETPVDEEKLVEVILEILFQNNEQKGA